MSKNDFSMVKQFFRENKAKKMPLKHFSRLTPYFLSDFHATHNNQGAGKERVKGHF